MSEQMDERRAGYTNMDWLWIGLAAATLVPLIAIRFLNVARGSAFAMAAATGLAIRAAALLAWTRLVLTASKLVPRWRRLQLQEFRSRLAAETAE